MTVDAREGDNGFYTVLLDGVDISVDCQFADDEKGAALCLLRDASGLPYVSPYRTDEIAREWRRGRVEILAHD